MEKTYRYTVAGHTFGITLPAQIPEQLVLTPYQPFRANDIDQNGTTNPAEAPETSRFTLKVTFVPRGHKPPVGPLINRFNEDAPYMWLFQAPAERPGCPYVFGFSNNTDHSDCFLYASADFSTAEVCLPEGLLNIFARANDADLTAAQAFAGRGAPWLSRGIEIGPLIGGHKGNPLITNPDGKPDPRAAQKATAAGNATATDDAKPADNATAAVDASAADNATAAAADPVTAADNAQKPLSPELQQLQRAMGMMEFVLTNCMMLLYTSCTAAHDTLMTHSSVIRYKGKGYMFLGKSGTGKSTHSSLWLKYIEGAELLNDDNPIIRIVDGQALVYGSPWSGKTPCYKNIEAPLGAIVRLSQAPENKISRLGVLQAFAALLPSCSCMKWDHDAVTNVHKTLEKVVTLTPIFGLDCLPDQDAAITCRNAVVAD